MYGTRIQDATDKDLVTGKSNAYYDFIPPILRRLGIRRTLSARIRLLDARVWCKILIFWYISFVECRCDLRKNACTAF